MTEIRVKSIPNLTKYVNEGDKVLLVAFQPFIIGNMRVFPDLNKIDIDC